MNISSLETPVLECEDLLESLADSDVSIDEQSETEAFFDPVDFISATTRQYLIGFYEDFLSEESAGRVVPVLENMLSVLHLEGRLIAEQAKTQRQSLAKCVAAGMHNKLPVLRSRMLQTTDKKEIIRYTFRELNDYVRYGLRDGISEEIQVVDGK